jgi:predicted metalloprotease with PDZ domain
MAQMTQIRLQEPLRTPRSQALRIAAIVCVLLLTALQASAQPAAFEYRLSFPSPEHRWMEVEARFGGLPAGTAEIRMSRTSPGRYALHEFAKNVFDVRISDAAGKELPFARPNLHQWNVPGHDGTVVVTYKVFGDRTDGTYLSVDAAHAHMNMPATVMFVRGQLARSARVTFVQPAGRQWRVATQLFSTSDPLVYTAPNIHYLMDSPTEFSDFSLRSVTIDDGVNGPQTIRAALHHDGSDADADAYIRDVEKTVREAMKIFGELPKFDAGTYTFLADYLPWADGDGMEHRNSTVVSNRGALRNPGQRAGILGTISHEFFHSWNMERLRSKGIEPFDYEEADVSDDLWFGEGFTNYFDGLILERAQLMPTEALLADFAGIINTVTLSPGRQLRSAVEMSRLAPFVDAATSVDRTAWPNLFISYYTYGSAIAMGLDLSLRDRTDGKLTIDSYMRALWRQFGRASNQTPGAAPAPYTIRDLERTLAEVSGDPAFARDFFQRYVEGRELVDYAKLFMRAGFVLRKRAAGRGWLGEANLQPGPGGARVTSMVPFGSPLYKAGVAQDDVVVSLDGTDLGKAATVEQIIGKHQPGATIPIRFVRRAGEKVEQTITLEEDPRIEIVPVESAGGTLSAEQKRFRDAWLNAQ